MSRDSYKVRVLVTWRIRHLVEIGVSKYGKQWSRDELVLALYLYCQIPFGQTSHRNPEVVHLAYILGRTPSSVAKKLGNFGAFDPVLAKRGVTGLTHGSKADKNIWDEFFGRWDLLVEESQKILAQGNNTDAFVTDDETETAKPIPKYAGETVASRLLSVRLCQSFFRRAVLSSYRNACCVCGLDIPPLLTASHIIPWYSDDSLRADPQNGLCLCALHDRAFDRGLIAVDVSLTVTVSSLVFSSRAPVIDQVLLRFRNQSVMMPYRFAPKPEYLQWHLTNIFRP